jgi:hypothetical protein
MGLTQSAEDVTEVIVVVVVVTVMVLTLQDIVRMSDISVATARLGSAWLG